MKNKLQNNKNQILFGTKCILLAIAIIISALVLLCDYIFPNGIDSTIYTILRICPLVIVAVVMIFEIVPYIQLSNAGIRNIYREKDIQIEKLNKFNKINMYKKFIKDNKEYIILGWKSVFWRKYCGSGSRSSGNGSRFCGFKLCSGTGSAGSSGTELKK